MTWSEFAIVGAHRYDRKSAPRWIVSHLLRNKRWLASFLLGTIAANAFGNAVPLLVGTAFNEILRPAPSRATLLTITLEILAVVLARVVFDLTGRFSAEILSKRFKRDARDELFSSLLGKSQTFHNRQRVGDLMARAANDVGQLSNMIVPGVDIIVDSFMTLIVAMVYIGFLKPELLLAPLLFTVAFLIALRDYSRKLGPVTADMREQFGRVNAGLNEAIAGVEVVKAAAQEEQEAGLFNERARRYRDLFVRNGEIQARYIPPLLLTIATVGAFVHGVLLVSQGQLSVGSLVAYLGLMGMLGFPAFISIFSFSLVQLGLASARRILALMAEEAELDENTGGHVGQIQGEIVFENVSFQYGDKPVLKNVSFRVKPGQAVAIVGRTGAGKSTLTKLINRIYDASDGRVLVDGIDVRDWNLASLRSQVSTIEQDVFLFSRSVAENIAFGLGQQTTPEAIERAARDAQVHDFAMAFKDGYATIIGERGVTLSGGQRQRLAIARALLTDPRILVLDDSTSAIDSATEDEIQKAIRRGLEGRTTILIT
ncbi:MAG TPA: ABC transporter ATP-binding protein, partial [Chloroflexota bacterium]|nr:ABC transporter ATP-binding protein [Chloroflexota bacterium]